MGKNQGFLTSLQRTKSLMTIWDKFAWSRIVHEIAPCNLHEAGMSVRLSHAIFSAVKHAF